MPKKEVDLLRAPKGGCRHVFVDAGLRDHVFCFEIPFG